MRRPLLAALAQLIIAACTAVTAAPAQSVSVLYREPADVFEILDHVSDWWPGYVESAYRKHWTDSIGFRPGDSAVFARYAKLRETYFDKRGQGNSAPRRDGSGLFTDRAVLDADPVGAAFYRSDTFDAAFDALRTVVTPDDLRFLRMFYARFRPRVATMVAQTQALTTASRAVTAASLASADVGAYLGQVGRLFGVDTTAPFTALYIWWPDTLQRMASPSGRHLLLRVRPASGETVNSADVVAHEAIHVLASLASDAMKRDVSAAVLDRCTVPSGVRRLAVVEEPIATALGNIEFRRRFMPQRFAWGRRWYGDDWVDMSARLLHPVLTAALADANALGVAFGRDAGALCALLTRTRGASAP
jgi:hypothetical protein